jgi:hypothetical protein
MLQGMTMPMAKHRTDIGAVRGREKKDREKILNPSLMVMPKHADLGPLGVRARDQEIRYQILMPTAMPIGIKHHVTPGPPGVGA